MRAHAASQARRPGRRRGWPIGPRAFPATDGSADLRLPPSQSAIKALRQFRFSAGTRKTLVIPRQLFCTGVPRCCPAGGYPYDEDGFRRAARPSLAD